MFKEQLNANMKKSVTLIEVLISAVFLTIIFTGILFVFAKCIILNEHNRNVTMATLHTQYVMEDIKNNNFSLIADSINNGDWDWGVEEIAAEGLSPLNSEVIAVNVDGTDLLDIEINVTWNNLEGRASPINIGFQTLLASP
ncbi:MAG: hypothetical protein KAJ14_03500 [Candidatus Omnitrophica bacterium]|nr:hypothetical protein [Candidatus Omnitrophota bacterium]MCK5492157.1 hypothetical protein [Candidatus Omnitrophota bacterium]